MFFRFFLVGWIGGLAVWWFGGLVVWWFGTTHFSGQFIVMSLLGDILYHGKWVTSLSSSQLPPSWRFGLVAWIGLVRRGVPSWEMVLQIGPLGRVVLLGSPPSGPFGGQGMFGCVGSSGFVLF